MTLPPAADPAPPPGYVALGDSFAAGLGAGPATDPCWRALGGYPVLVAQALGTDLAYQACLGATVADVVEHQLGALGPHVSHVSVTVGGNDADFVPVVLEAAKPEWAADLDRVLGVALETIRTRLPARLDDLFTRVRRLAPGAEVVVTGYPRLFNGVDCSLLTFFSGADMDRLDAAGDLLVTVVGASAQRAGVRFVDVRDVFEGHAVCDAVEWLNGVSLPIEASFHPNPAGHVAYARAVAQAFGVVPEPVGPGAEELVPGSGGVRSDGDSSAESAGQERWAPAARAPRVVLGPPVPGSAPTFADWPRAILSPLEGSEGSD